MADARLKKLRIQTGVCARTYKEKVEKFYREKYENCTKKQFILKIFITPIF